MNSPTKNVIQDNDDIEMKQEDGTTKVLSNQPLISSKYLCYLESSCLSDPSKSRQSLMENSSVISDELIPKKTSLIKGTSELAEANEGDLTDTSSVLPLYEKDGLDPQEVLNVDIPERIIEKYKDRDLKELSTEDRISSFAHWLKERKFSDKMSEELIKVLIFIITKHRVEFYDVPYIATYFQKEISRVGLKSDDVYLMFSLYEEEYLSFENEKDRAVLLFHILENYISPIKDQKDLFYNVYINECKDLTELNFVNNYFDMLVEINSNDQSNTELQVYRNKCSTSFKANSVIGAKLNKIDEFLAHFTLPPFQVAENLKKIQMNELDNVTKPSEPKVNPILLVKDYLNKTINQEMFFFTHACDYYALTIGTHPYIKTLLWKHYVDNATLSTEPTQKGLKELDINHELYKTKRILNRKVSSFFENDNKGCDYMDILSSEKQGYIKVILKSELTKESYTSLITLLSNAVNGGEPDEQTNNDISLKYRAIRNQACLILVQNKFKSQFKEQLTMKLEQYAESKLILELRESFSKILSYTPIAISTEPFYIMSCSYDPQTNKVYCTILNQYGVLIHSACYTKIMNNPVSLTKEEDKKNYYKEEEDLTTLLKQYTPKKIIVGANDLNCIRLKEVLSNNANKDDIIYAPTLIPSIYAKSEQAKNDYMTYYKNNPSKKEFEWYMLSISQGRCALNMIGEVSKVYSRSLMYEDKLCLSKKQCYVQRKDLLCKVFETEIIKRVNDIGVDLPYIVIAKDFQNVLKYVSGFGEIISNFYINEFIKDTKKSRAELKCYFSFKEKLYENCISFLKFREGGLIYDSMRLLQSQYKEAEKYLTAFFGSNDIDSIIKGVYYSKTDSIMIKEEDRSKYDQFILNELTLPFAPTLPQITKLDKEDIFAMMTNQNLSCYTIQLCTVINNDTKENIITCMISNGNLTASILYDEIDNSTSLYQENYIFKAMIKSITINDDLNYSIMLTRKKEEIEKIKNALLEKKEYMNFDFSQEDSISLDISDNKQKYASFLSYKKIEKGEKNIFFNENYSGAIMKLKYKSIGDFVFRPSIFGPDYYTLSYKVEEGIYNHIQIKNMGESLSIDGQEYKDFQEIQQKYMNPITQFLKDIKKHSKYAILPRLNDFKKRLSQEKELEKVNRRKIFYHLSYLEHYPQYLVLGYTPTAKTTVFEYISIKSNGLLFHNNVFSNIEDLVSFFKNNYGKETYFAEMKKMTVPESNIEDITMEMAITQFEGEDPNKETYKSSLGNRAFNRYDNKGLNKTDNQGWVSSNNDIEPGWNPKNDNNNTNQNGWGSVNENTTPVEQVNSGWGPSMNEIENNSLAPIKEEQKEVPSANWGSTDNSNQANTQWGALITEEPKKEELPNNIKEENKPNPTWGIQPTDNTSTPNPEWGTHNTEINSTGGQKPTENNTNTSSWGTNPTDNNVNSSTNWGPKPIENNTNTTTAWGRNNNNETSGWGQSSETNNNNSNWDANDNKSSWGNSNDGPSSNNNETSQEKSWNNRYNEDGGKRRYDNNRIGGRRYNNNDGGYRRGGDRGRGRGRGRGGRGRGGYRNERRNDNDGSSGGWNDNRNNSSNNDGWETKAWNNNKTEYKKQENNWGSSGNSGWETSTNNNNNSWGTTNVDNKDDTSNAWGTNNVDNKTSTGRDNTNDDKKNTVPEQSWGISDNNNNVNSGWGTYERDQPENTKEQKTISETKPSLGNEINKPEEKKSDKEDTKQDQNPWVTNGNNEEKAKTSVEQSSWGVTSSNDNQQTYNWGGNGSSDNKDTGNWGTTTTNNNQTNSWGTNDNNNQTSNWNQSNNDKQQDWGDINFGFGNDNTKSSYNGDNQRRQFNKGDKKKGCYNCGEEGHMSRDCPNKKTKVMKCYNCGEEGHLSKDCPQPKKERNNKCFNCGEGGHKSHDCPHKRTNKCFKCGAEDHQSRDCPNKGNNYGNKAPMKCYNCGEEGHSVKDCPKPKKMKCYNCGEEGHTSNNCTKPQKERGPRRGKRDNQKSSKPFENWDKTSKIGWGGQPSKEKEEGELQETPKEDITSGWGNNNNNEWGTIAEIKNETMEWGEHKEEPTNNQSSW